MAKKSVDPVARYHRHITTASICYILPLIVDFLSPRCPEEILTLLLAGNVVLGTFLKILLGIVCSAVLAQIPARKVKDKNKKWLVYILALLFLSGAFLYVNFLLTFSKCFVF